MRDRLLAVDWDFGLDETREQTRTRIALFREFLRRAGGAFGLDRSGLIQIGIATLGFDTAADWLDEPKSAHLPDFPDLDGTWPS
ncbi:MAG TPA: hypothetical protein VFU78_18120 [Thermomicrobiales bacterium]|nr:hypothetical protein [Thermomicrobiales bacterium]